MAEWMQRPLVALMLLALGMAFIPLNDAFIKLMSVRLPLAEITLIRGVMTLAILAVASTGIRAMFALSLSDFSRFFARGMCLVVAMVLFFTALGSLPLPTCVAIFFIAPLLITVLSVPFLGERIGIFRWSAVIVGMFGIVLLTNPFSGGFSSNVIYGLMGALAGAGLSIFLRRLGKVDHPFSVAVWYNGVGSVMLTLLVVGYADASLFAVSPDILRQLLLLGIVAAGLQLCITSAFRFSEAVVISSMRYLQIPMAAFVAYLMFDEVMAPIELTGGAVVIDSCVFIAWREFIRARGRQAITGEDAA